MIPPKLSTFTLLFNFLFMTTLLAQSMTNLTESGQVNRLVLDEVASSPAFITRTQFVEAWNAAIPYLPKPDNVTHLDVSHYPLFLNSAVKIGKINNTTQLAMYLAHIFYQTNGLSVRQVMPCTRFGTKEACRQYIGINVNNTGAFNNTFTGKLADYRGRGFLFLENVDSYTSASHDIYGNDMLYKFPNLVAHHPEIAWATSAWTWNKRVGSLVGSSDAFGLSTKFLRPGDCSNSANQQMSDNARMAFNIYQQILGIFDSDREANAAGCVM